MFGWLRRKPKPASEVVFTSEQIAEAAADRRLINIEKDDWATGYRHRPVKLGIISKSGKRIDWDNGAWWERKSETWWSVFTKENGYCGKAQMRFDR